MLAWPTRQSKEHIMASQKIKGLLAAGLFAAAAGISVWYYGSEEEPYRSAAPALPRRAPAEPVLQHRPDAIISVSRPKLPASPTAAFLGFSAATGAWVEPARLQILSDAAMSGLPVAGDIRWVERGEMDHLLREWNMTALSAEGASTKLKLGRLLKADLLLQGVIRRSASGAPSLTVECIDAAHADVVCTRELAMKSLDMATVPHLRDRRRDQSMRA